MCASSNAPIGDVLCGKAPGRRDDEELTVFVPVGLAVQDLAAAAFLYDKAKRLRAGDWLEF